MSWKPQRRAVRRLDDHDEPVWAADAERWRRSNMPAPWMPGYWTLTKILGPTPTTWGEDPAAFAELERRLNKLFSPSNGVEEGFTRDLVFWRAHGDRLFRWWRELRPDVQAHGLRVVLRDVLGEGRLSTLVDRFLARDLDARTELDRALAGVGLNLDQATAVAVAMRADVAQLAQAARDCATQMDRLWRRIEQSRDVRDRAHRFVNKMMRREQAADEKIRKAEFEGLRDSLLKGRATHEIALRPWRPPFEPSEAIVQDDAPSIVPQVQLTYERPDFAAEYAELMDLLPWPNGDGGDREVDIRYLYYNYLLSTYPADILEQSFVRSAVEARVEQNELQHRVVDIAGFGLAAELLKTLRTLAPGVDHGELLSRYRVDPDVCAQVEGILAPAGLTIARLEARGALRNIMMMSALQKRLADAQRDSIGVDKALEDRRAGASIRSVLSPDRRRRRA